jgi:hypothetical protein
MKTLKMMLLAGMLSAGVAGCGDSGSSSPSAGGPSSGGTIPAQVMLASAPAGAQSIDEIKKSSKEGDEVVLQGYVGGRKAPFTKDRAMMLVVDKGLANTCTTGADHCPTPWDYCCAEQDALTAKMATVQVMGADGKPVKADLKGAGGLKELSEVTVKGKIAKKDEGMLVINATGIHVGK